MGFGFIDVTPPVGPTVLALAWAQIVIYAIGLAVIVWQLWQMQQYGQQRDREIDEMAAAFREQAVEGGRRSEALAELLRRRA